MDQDPIDLMRRQLDAVHRISAAMYSVTDIGRLQQLALENAIGVIGADAGSVLVYDNDTNSLVFQHVVGPVASGLIGTRIDLTTESGIASNVFASGTTRISNDVYEESDHARSLDRRTGYESRSLITVPLRTRGGPVVGVMQLVNKLEGDFNADDAAVLEVMGSLLALATHNAVLAREAQMAIIARQLGELSHDIGNMLTNVLPYVQTLGAFVDDVREGKEGAIEMLCSFYNEVLACVTEGVEQVQALTREVAGAIKGEASPMNFCSGVPAVVARSVIRALSGAAHRHGVNLEIDCPQDFTAIFDERRVYNAIYNLVNNAIPETPEGGSVTVRLNPPMDGYYKISVVDTGKGMPEDIRVRLFTDAVRSTKAAGTGLGTRIVRRIVEQHGGSISVTSQPDKGTTVTLRLPVFPIAES
jgi:signal transduction histidine kinase